MQVCDWATVQSSSKATVRLRLVVRFAGLHKSIEPPGIRALPGGLGTSEGLRVIEHR